MGGVEIRRGHHFSVLVPIVVFLNFEKTWEKIGLKMHSKGSSEKRDFFSRFCTKSGGFAFTQTRNSASLATGYSKLGP